VAFVTAKSLPPLAVHSSNIVTDLQLRFFIKMVKENGKEKPIQKRNKGGGGHGR
jgi:hypothetical protein